jgi:phenylacetate-CoA ligase
MEVLNVKGNEVSFGEEGEVVSTGFLNYDQPLIRYRIGDRVIVDKNQQTKSDVKMLKIKKIEGRSEDVIIGTNGQKMVRFHSVFVGISSIVMAQVEQHSYKNIVVNLVVDNNYLKTNEELMIARIKSQLGEMKVEFNYVSEIERTKAGKFKAVISYLENG